MDLDCLSENVSISRLSDYQKKKFGVIDKYKNNISTQQNSQPTLAACI